MRGALLGAVAIAIACSGATDNGPPPSMLQLVDNFASPVYLTSSPNDSARLFIVEQGGTIVIRRRDTTLTRPFLDVRGQIDAGGERGLLSVAFDPNYATSGRFFVYFTNKSGDIRVVRYTVSSDPDSADEATADTTLKVAHPGNRITTAASCSSGRTACCGSGRGTGEGEVIPTAMVRTSTRCSASCCASM